MNSTPALASDYIRALHEDQQRALWIGTAEGGLVRYQDGSFNRFGTNDDLLRMTVYTIREDATGTLWAGTSRGVLKIPVNERGARKVDLNLLPGEDVIGVEPSRGKDIWLSTRKAIHKVVADRLAGSIVTTREIHALAVDERGQPWVSFAAGGMGRPGANDSFLDITRWRTKVDAMYLAKDGTLWAGTMAGALWRVDESLAEYHHHEEKLPARILAIYTDQDGSLW